MELFLLKSEDGTKREILSNEEDMSLVQNNIDCLGSRKHNAF